MRIVLALIITAFLVGGCKPGFRRVEGNGVRQTKEKALNDFDELEISGAFKIILVQSDTYKAVVEADENLQEYVRIEQSGDRLRIKMRNNVNYHSSHGIKITVYGNDIDRIELAGSSSLETEGQIENNDHIYVTIAGSGDADMELKTPETKVSIGGSGEVKLKGKTRDLKLNIAGSGDFEGGQFLSENANISIAGSGSAKVFTSMELKVSIAGSGDVYYAGNPKNIKKSVAGSGNIHAIE